MSRGSSKSKKPPKLPASSKPPSVATRGKPFPYKRVALDPNKPHQSSLVPGISIVIHGPTGRIPILGLIDSGADSLLMPWSFAPPLGITKDKCDERPCLGANGEGVQYVYPPGVEYEVQPVNNTRIVSGAAFTEGLPERIVLLGRQDFFRVFKVSFDERSEIFWLEKYA